jgi:hypothetical protein
MTLSTKIISGFILTNIIYLLLLGATFIIVRPLTRAASELESYIIPVSDLASDVRYNVAEQRSFIRAYAADPNLSQQTFDQAAAFNKAANEDLKNLGRIFADPAAALLATPAITDAYQKMLAAAEENAALVFATPDMEQKYLHIRRQFSATAQDALAALAGAI